MLVRDARLQDPQVLDEIELYGELVIAASASEQPLSRDEIDRVLGLRAPPRATSASPADGCPDLRAARPTAGPGLPGDLGRWP